MTRSALSLLVVWLCATSVTAQTVRIATYNINWSNRRGDAILDAVHAAKPDIICFQESTTQSERFLRDRLATSHPYFYATGHQGRFAAERFSIASNRPLSAISFVPPVDGLFGFYSVNFLLGDKSVHLVSVHLTPFQIRPNSNIFHAMAELSQTEKTHAAEVAVVSRAIDPTLPTIIVGDFNSISIFNAPQTLAKIGLIDAFAAVHPDADSHATWHWPTRPVPLALRVDYIFHTKHFAAKDATIIHRDGSDHSLVVAELLLDTTRLIKTPTTKLDSKEHPKHSTP